MTETGKIKLNQLNSKTGNRVQQRLIDSMTGAEVNRADIIKGYEYSKGKYVVLTDDEMDELQVDSSKMIELDTFVDRDSVDQVYVDAPYYVYPDGAHAPETFQVISEAMISKGKVGLGRVTISGRERQVLVEPRGLGLLMSTLRSAKEVKTADPTAGAYKAHTDPEMIAVAGMIIDKRAGKFDPVDFHDRYQDALQALVQAKVSGVALVPTALQQPAPMINLMDALKRSVAEAANANAKPPVEAKAPAKKKAAVDRRQTNLLLPVKGGAGAKAAPAAEERPVEEVKLARSRKKAG